MHGFRRCSTSTQTKTSSDPIRVEPEEMNLSGKATHSSCLAMSWLGIPWVERWLSFSQRNGQKASKHSSWPHPGHRRRKTSRNAEAFQDEFALPPADSRIGHVRPRD